MEVLLGWWFFDQIVANTLGTHTTPEVIRRTRIIDVCRASSLTAKTLLGADLGHTVQEIAHVV